MPHLLRDLAEFIITPFTRWILIFISIILTTLQYYNEPQRFSYKTGIIGLSYKWELYLIAIFICVTTTLTLLGFWVSIPFTDMLPDYWYIGFLILYMGLITQITLNSEQVKNVCNKGPDGKLTCEFNPPPTYMLPQKYRVMLTYTGLIVFIVIMIQMYIYYDVVDYSKKTLLSRYVLERYGGWYPGNKLDFILEWSGLIDCGLKLYILYLQTNFQACNYGLPSSWNA